MSISTATATLFCNAQSATKLLSEDWATVQPGRNTKPSIPSTGIDSTRRSNYYSENLKPAQLTRSAEVLFDPAEATTAAHNVHDHRLTLPDPVEIKRDVAETALVPEKTTAAATEEAPLSPMRRSTKRSALDALDEDGVQTRSSKRGRVSAPAAEVTGVLRSSTDSGSSSRESRTKTRVLRSRRVKVDATQGDLATNEPGPSVARSVRKARTAKKPANSVAVSSKKSSSSSRGTTMDTGEETGRARRGRQLTASSTSAPGESGPAGRVSSLARSTTNAATRGRRSADTKAAKAHEPTLGRHVPLSQSTGSVIGGRQRGHVKTDGGVGSSRLVSAQLFSHSFRVGKKCATLWLNWLYLTMRASDGLVGWFTYTYRVHSIGVLYFPLLLLEFIYRAAGLHR
jgi:hypothetical protein